MTVHDFPAVAVTLKRVRSGPDGVFGRLYLDGRQIAVTCEDPWNDNRRGESCIPAGKYLCVPHTGTKYKKVWEVTSVPGRSAILIHQGNTTDDTQGCILVGDRFGTVEGKPAVVNSRTTLDGLRRLLPENFFLVIDDIRI